MKPYDPAASIAGTVLDVETSPDQGDHTVARGDDLVGHIFVGRYQIEKQIASGTMGRVYLGTQLRLERPVAIKILKQWGNAIDPRFAKRFCREASIASQLSHPNIVSIYDYGETDDRRLFMVMEHLEGTPLHELIREKAPLTAERALSIAIQIARALRRAHASGVVHRDLKPANVVVKTDEEGFDFVKVLDFGLVKLFSPEESSVLPPDDDDHLTRPGNMVGTPDYVSPEQALGDQVDGRTDIYSLGVLMFQMVAGRLPFMGGSIIDMVKQHLNAPVPWIAQLVPGVECREELELIIRRCMCKNRDERFASMEEVLVALKSAWRNVTDESFGTETSNASLLPNDLQPFAPPPILPAGSTSSEVAFASRGAVPAADPSEVSRPSGGDFALAHEPRMQAPWTAAISAVLLAIAIVCGAFVWRMERGAPRIVAPAERKAVAPPTPVLAPIVVPARDDVEAVAMPEGDPVVEQAAPAPAPVPVHNKKTVKRPKKARVYKDNPF